MPKYVRYKKPSTKDLADKKRSRAYRILGTKNEFLDAFPLGFGTIPEKMVYTALSIRGIKFHYLNDITFTNSEIDFMKKYQADFILPDYKIIIEVQGLKWHSSPAAIEADAFKMAVYEQFGYKALAWWDFEILQDINALFRREPLLSGIHASNSGSTEVVIKRTKTDSSKGIRTMNQRRKIRLAYRKKPVNIKGRKRKTYGTAKTYNK